MNDKNDSVKRKDTPTVDLHITSQKVSEWVANGLTQDKLVPPGTYHQMSIDYLLDGNIRVRLWDKPESGIIMLDESNPRIKQ